MHGYRGYLELIRPANVATALADVLAGYAVAGLGNHAALGWLLVSTACLYAGGVVLNDVFDRDIDRTERPERPIPSGRVSVGAASGLGGGLLALGVLAGSLATAAAGMVAAATAASVLLYDAWGKRQGLLGPVNMGMCRGLNLLLGIAAAPADVGRGLAARAAAPRLHRGRNRGEPGRGARRTARNRGFRSDILERWCWRRCWRWPSGTVAGHGQGVGFAALLAWRVLPAFWGAYQTPEPGPIRHAIRTGVLSLVLLDAVIGATYGGALYSLVIVATGLVASSLARLFAVT